MQKSMKTLPIEQIKPYENNPRLNDDAVEAVRKSMEQCGYIAPIVVDENNVVLAGHTRLKALKEMGAKECEVLEVTGLSDDEKRKYRLLDNKTNELALWDFDALADELEWLDFEDLELDWGVDLDGDLVFDEPPEEDDFDEDETDEHGVQSGQVWKLGEHRLMCGDSTSRENVDNLIAGGHIDMIFTDPPYGMGLDMNFSSMKTKICGDLKSRDYSDKENNKKVDSFEPEMIDVVFEIDSKECFLWGADYYAERLKDKNKGSWIVWDKRATEENYDTNAPMESDRMYGSTFELCWSKKKHRREIARVKWCGIMGLSSQDIKHRLHPTQKPIELCDWFLDRYSDEGDTILDLFGGSGSTLIACEQLGRKCYMMEIDPHYCDVIISRWENYTGEKAVLIAG